MIASLVRAALVQRVMVLALVLAIIAGGVWAFQGLAIDAFPDISATQVQIVVKAPGMSPTEVEQRISMPIEREMQGIPRQTVLRSTTKFAITNIIMDFEDGTDIYWARGQVTERLNALWGDLPEGVEGGLGPITSPLGEMYIYRVEGEGYSVEELRTLQDWVIRPRLRTVDGVADVNSSGGRVRAYEVEADPDRLAARGLGLAELEDALAANNRNAGGGRIDRNNEMILVRTEGNLQGIEDIEQVTVATRDGVPILVRDVATVGIGALTPNGGVTANGEGTVVAGIALLRKGANTRAAVEGVKREVEELASVLPEGVRIVPIYDRTELIEAAVGTVEKALTEAVVLVLIVLVVMLGNLRSALTTAVILPLSVLTTFILMRIFGVTANLMSLGGLAIAIGILVDAAVVIVENVQTQLGRAPKGVDRLHVVYRATTEVAVPVVSGVLIIILVFLPLFSLTGLEGKMFLPLALTICIALASSLVLSLTVIPVLASVLMRGEGEEHGRVQRFLTAVYAPVVDWALRWRALAVTGGVLGLGLAALLFTRIGSEFMPSLDEGSTILIIEKLPSVSLDRSLALDAPFQRAMMELPEVTGVFSRTGVDELGMDPMGLYQTDNFVLTRPRSEWKITPEQFQENLREKMGGFIGIVLAFTQPIDMRVSEMLTGVRAAMSIRLFGDDLLVLEEKAKEIEAMLGNVEGAIDIFRGQIFGQGYLQIDIRHEAIARFGLSAEDINGLVETAVAGRPVTEVLENERRISVLLRYPKAARDTPQAIGAMLVATPTGERVPLSALADIREVDGPVQISRESARRSVVVQANVEGRDVVGFVEEVRARLEKDVPLPQGYYVTFGGQFENQQRAAERLGIVVPISITLIFLMLFTTFGSVRQAGLILLNVPFGLIGGVISLFLSGLYMSVPASVGFITLFGVAVLNGVVMVTYFNQLRASGRSLDEAVREGAVRRLRPVLLTAMIASLGLVPMLLATGPGSEIQRPLAVVVIGGLFSSTLLTLVLLPTLYAWLEGRAERRLTVEITP
ncbi:MAG: CusA/CzcA family heavy metal efflux RND transporter [Pseudomonadota bacterium]|nr:CusA/CzcA family heavy metal efflux RND transporter [Pseudomonadota bacterium]